MICSSLRYIVLTISFDSQFQSGNSVYHAHGLTALATLESLMTFKKEDFKKAIDAADRTLSLSNQLTKVRFRHTQFLRFCDNFATPITCPV